MSRLDITVRGTDRQGDKHLDVYEMDAGSDLQELKEFLQGRYQEYKVLGATPPERHLMFTVRIQSREMVLPLETMMELVPCMIALDITSENDWEPLKIETFEEFILDMMGEE